MAGNFPYHPKHSEKIVQNLNKIRDDPVFCDGIVIIEGERIPVQRNLLASSSSYFRALYKYDSDRELNQTKPHPPYEVTLNYPGIKAETFHIILDYIYQCDIDLNAENINTLLCASDVLLMDDLKEICCEFLESKICTDNCLSILDLAEMFSCHGILNMANRFIDENILYLQNQTEFLELSVKKLKELASRRSLKVSSEKDVLMLIISWVKHKPAERLQNVDELFNKNVVKLHQVDVQILKCMTDEIKEMMLTYNLSCDKLSSIMDISTINTSSRAENAMRGYTDILVVTGGYGTTDNSIQSQCYFVQIPDTKIDPITATWNKLPDMNYPRTSHGLVQAGGFLFAAGGLTSDNSPTSTVEMYDPSKNKWTMVSSMMAERFGFGLHAKSSGDKLYAVCGSTLNSGSVVTPRDKTELYDIFKNEWLEVAPVLTPRICSASAISPQGKIFVLGGSVADRLIESVEEYNSKLDTWKPIAPLNERRYDGSAVVLEDYLYVFGGKRPNQCPSMAHHGQRFCSTEFFPLSTDNQRRHKQSIWQSLPRDQLLCTMTESSDIYDALPWKRQILIVGKLDMFNRNHCVRTYIPYQNVWKGVILNQPPSVRYSAAVLRVCNEDLWNIMNPNTS